MDENKQIQDKQNAKIVLIINAVIALLTLVFCFIKNEDVGMGMFFVAALTTIIDLILMIVFFATKNTTAGVVALIAMFIVPIIGFGACANNLHLGAMH